MNQKELERELRKIYKDTSKTIADRLKKQTEAFVKMDTIYQDKVKKGLMAEREYIAWRRNQLLNSEWAKRLYAELETDITNASETAAEIINGGTKAFYAEGFNEGLYEIEKGVKAVTTVELCSTETVERILTQKPEVLPKAGASRWGKKRLRNAVAQAVVKGESIPKFAKRLKVITGMEGASAIRNARTIMSSARNGGRQQVAEDASNIGISLKKVWLATLDERTRHSHREMDGVQVNVDKPFDVNGSELMFPADPQGEPAEVYNCRCTMVYNVDNNLSSVRPEDIKRVGNIGNYDDWKSNRKK